MTIETRKEYMAKSHEDRDHHAFYAQFVTEAEKAEVIRMWTLEGLCSSVDEHMNDRPLKYWDRGCLSYESSQLMKQAGMGYSLSNLVCTLKTAARIVVAEAKEQQ